MKNINIELEDETYWKLRSLKTIYKAEKWSDLIDMLLDVLQVVGKESVLNGDLGLQTKDLGVQERKSSEKP